MISVTASSGASRSGSRPAFSARTGLTPAAYALLGQRTFEAIGARVKPGETVVCFGDSLTFGASVKGAGTAEGETYPAALKRCFDARR